MPIDISVNRHTLPLQQLSVRQMSILLLTEHFLNLGSAQSTKVYGAKVKKLGCKCTSRV